MFKDELIIIKGKRYYHFDMTNELPVLFDTIPYYFKYGDIEIYESAWNRMALKIIEELDRKYPHEESWYLSLSYSFSKMDVFSKFYQVNFSKFKNIYLNTNHTAMHAMMSIQYLLKEFGIKLNECYFLIKRHPSVEPKEIRDFYRKDTIDNFSSALCFNGLPKEKISKIIGNFVLLNKLLSSISDGFDDFFLFDDYYMFLNYKQKVIELAREKFAYNYKAVAAIENTLNYLSDFYKKRDFYEKASILNINDSLKSTFIDEIKKLFDVFHVTTITISKLFSRMNIMHEKLMNNLGDLNNSESLFYLLESTLSKNFYFKYPMISQNKSVYLNNDELIMDFIQRKKYVSINDINDFAEKMLLNKPTNYLQFMIDLSDSFVQISQDQIVKKEVLSINEDDITEIKKELVFYINSFGCVNTINFKGYSTLPKAPFKWNKYFLVGIVRTYLSNTFEINYNGNTYRTVNFEIKLKQNINKI